MLGLIKSVCLKEKRALFHIFVYSLLLVQTGIWATINYDTACEQYLLTPGVLTTVSYCVANVYDAYSNLSFERVLRALAWLSLSLYLAHLTCHFRDSEPLCLLGCLSLGVFAVGYCRYIGEWVMDTIFGHVKVDLLFSQNPVRNYTSLNSPIIK